MPVSKNLDAGKEKHECRYNNNSLRMNRYLIENLRGKTVYLMHILSMLVNKAIFFNYKKFK